LSLGGDGKLYWQDYGGGWYMEDTTYVQSAFNKSVMVRDGNLEVCSGGACPSLINAGHGNLLTQYEIEIASGGLFLNTSKIEKPECNASSRGLIWTDYGKPEGDRSFVCLKSSSDEYLWEFSTPWRCGDNITFTYKGEQVTYGTVEVDYGGEIGIKCWMDRNLGATAVATAYNDSNGYGDLFQWGRLDDNHQDRESNTTSTISSTDDPGHDQFISSGSDNDYDWLQPRNDDLWQGDGGINDPCPSGWRVPTETEWDNERLSWGSGDIDRDGAIASPLKLPAAGMRHGSTDNVQYVGDSGTYWSSSIDATEARRLHFSHLSAQMVSGYRAHGLSVRCLQD